MSIYVYVFLSAVAGILVGMWCGLLFCKQRAKVPKEVNNKKKSRRSRPTSTGRNRKRVRKVRYSTDDDADDKNILKKKLKRPKVSMLEFSNAADGLDHEQYIKERRAKEDNAYTILKDDLKEGR